MATPGEYLRVVNSQKWALPFAEVENDVVGLCRCSPIFTIGRHQFRLQIYAGGFDRENAESIALFLEKADEDAVEVEFSLAFHDGFKKVVIRTKQVLGAPVDGRRIFRKYGSRESIAKNDESFRRMINFNEGFLIVLCDVYNVSNACSCLNVVSHFTGLKDHYMNGTFADAVVKVGAKEIAIHKVIVCNMSDVFKATFKSDMVEGRSSVTCIEGHDIDSVCDMLEYCYTRNFSGLSKKQVGDLYVLADKYFIEPLKVECENFLIAGLSIDNVLKTLNFADRFSIQKLREKAMNLFSEHKIALKTQADFSDFLNNCSNQLLIDLL